MLSYTSAYIHRVVHRWASTVVWGDVNNLINTDYFLQNVNLRYVLKVVIFLFWVILGVSRKFSKQKWKGEIFVIQKIQQGLQNTHDILLISKLLKRLRKPEKVKEIWGFSSWNTVDKIFCVTSFLGLPFAAFQRL